MITIRRGLDVPIAGSPQQVIQDGAKVRAVAVVGPDFIGMKPTMDVAVGDRVKTGQLLFTDKKCPSVQYTSPATGIVSAINRGAKRVLQSVVIDVEDDDPVEFTRYSTDQLASLSAEQVQTQLIASGLWVALRARPFSKVADPDDTPSSIFVTAIDTHPLAADPQIIIAEQQEAFQQGLTILSKLTQGSLYVCQAAGADLPKSDAANITVANFKGPHPAGLAGTHIHYLDPVNEKKQVWTIGYQDVIAIGHLFIDGKLNVQRVISLAGPSTKNPRLVRTRLGADVQQLCAGEADLTGARVVSGSVLGGRTANGALGYLGRYHNQVSVLEEGDHREFAGWMSPGFNKFSMMGIYISQLFKGKKFSMNTNTNGSERAMVPVGNYENVMPLDILPTQLLRSLIVGDTEMAQALGCLELDEEDLALCTFVCPGKYEYGPILRDNLTLIEKEG